MQRTQKDHPTRHSANSQRIAQPLRHSARGGIASLVDDSPLMAAQRKKLQGLFGSTVQRQKEPSPKPNHTGLPDHLKSGIESLSGLSMDHVQVHYNSSKPAQLSALAYAQGSDIHLAPGQEQHLPHEAWHVVQQAQGRVQPTMQMASGVAVNDDRGLEREADVMGARALANIAKAASDQPRDISVHAQSNVAQQKPIHEQIEAGNSMVTLVGDTNMGPGYKAPIDTPHGRYLMVEPGQFHLQLAASQITMEGEGDALPVRIGVIQNVVGGAPIDFIYENARGLRKRMRLTLTPPKLDADGSADPYYSQESVASLVLNGSPAFFSLSDTPGQGAPLVIPLSPTEQLEQANLPDLTDQDNGSFAYYIQEDVAGTAVFDYWIVANIGNETYVLSSGKWSVNYGTLAMAEGDAGSPIPSTEAPPYAKDSTVRTVQSV